MAERRGRLQQVDPQVMAQLKVAYQERCGASPKALIDKLALAFPNQCRDGGLVISHKTARNFFIEGAASPNTVEVLCQYLLDRSYEDCLQALNTIAIQQLPPPVHWVGRGEQLSRYCGWIQDRSVRVLLLTGEGGIGKTSLAEALAHKVREEFPTQVMVRLNEPKVPETLLLDLLEQLGHPQANRVKDRRQAVLQILKEHRCLILIDNLDTVIDNLSFRDRFQDYVQILEEWIDTDHQSLIVITSRIRPYLYPKSRAHLREDQLRGLPKPDWLPFFIVRYRDYTYGHLLEDPQQQAAIQTLGEQCDGHPLALHLVAGEALSRGEGDLQSYLMTYGDRACQEGVSQLIADQFERLRLEDPLGWKILTRLGVFRLPVPPAGIEQLLWDEPKINRANSIQSLVKKSLVQLDRGGYRLHPLIAQHSCDELQRLGWWQMAQTQAAQYWEQQPTRIDQGRQGISHWIEAFWHWCTLEAWVEAYRVFNQPLGDYPFRQQLLEWSYGQEVLVLLQPLLIHLTDPSLQLELLLTQCDANRKLGSFTQVQQIAHQTLLLSRSLGNRAAETDSLHFQGLVQLHLEQPTEAQSCFFEALAYSQAHQDRGREANNLNALGIAYYWQGDMALARNYYHEALTIFQERKEKNNSARCFNNLGIVEAEEGNYPESFYNYDKALQIHRRLLDKECEGAVLANIGWLYAKIGNFEQAEVHYQQALILARSIGQRADERIYLTNLSSVALDQEQYTNALGYCQEALALASPQDFKGPTLFCLGWAFEGLHRWQEAYGAYVNCLEQYLEDPVLKAEIHCRLAALALIQEDARRLQQYGDLALSHYQNYGVAGIQGMERPILFLLTCADVWTARAESTKAKEVLQTGYGILERKIALLTRPEDQERYKMGISAHRILIQRWQEATSLHLA